MPEVPTMKNSRKFKLERKKKKDYVEGGERKAVAAF